MTTEDMLILLERIRQQLRSLDNDNADHSLNVWLGFANNELLTVIKTVTTIKEKTT
jgi:hypothetical protein